MSNLTPGPHSQPSTDSAAPSGNSPANVLANPPAPAGNVKHNYPLAVRDASFSSALGLLMKTMPYALTRFGILVGCSVATILWWLIGFGGGSWLMGAVHPIVGWGWMIAAGSVYGWLWYFFVRYFLYLLKCGHIAVLTELITKGSIGNGSEGMFEYGKSVVTRRFGEVNALFALDALVGGVVRAINGTLDFVAGLLPIPGLDSVMGVVKAVLRAATTYVDETIFSYGLARGETNPWASAQDGLVYYAQNSKEVLKTAMWIVVLDWVLSGAAWVVMLVPAFIFTAILPNSVQGIGGFFSFGIAILFAANLRGAFLKPLFLIMMMCKFHVSVENQPINAEWDARLTSLSDKFRTIKDKVLGARTAPAPATRVA